MPGTQPLSPRFFHTPVEIPQGGWGPIRYIPATAPLWDVTLDLAKVVAHLKSNHLHLRDISVVSDHDTCFDVRAAKLRSVIKSIRMGPWRMIKLSVSPHVEGGIDFADGLHRIVVLHSAGYKTIKAEVAPEHLQLIKQRLGFVKPAAPFLRTLELVA